MKKKLKHINPHYNCVTIYFYKENQGDTHDTQCINKHMHLYIMIIKMNAHTAQVNHINLAITTNVKIYYE